MRLIYRRRIIWFFKGLLISYYWCEFEHYWYMKRFKDEIENKNKNKVLEG